MPELAADPLARWLGSDARAALQSGDVPLLCFPHAGGGASSYRGWESAAGGIRLLPVRLPGREHRAAEPAPAGIVPLAETIARSLEPVLTRSHALFGHSMGALVALEVAKCARDWFGTQPLRLYVSGCPGPAARRRLDVSLDDDTDLLSWVISLGGVPDAILADEELVAFLLPVIRRDLVMLDRYRARPTSSLTCPATVLTGNDDSTVDTDSLAAWSRETTARPEFIQFPGNHFYLYDEWNARELRRLFERDLVTPSRRTDLHAR
jgi:surfactin synthase thioesterase subunit